MIDVAQFDRVRAEWLAITAPPPIDTDRFARIKSEADALVAAGRWTSGPSDLLSVLGRHRDELTHSRILAWLLVPTNRHGLGRRVLTGVLDHLWPGERLLRSGVVTVETEVAASALDDAGSTRDARADLVMRGDGLTIVVENKVDAGEQPAQCERLYWSWVTEPGDVRWVFLTPSGRDPITATSDAAREAWRAIGYRDVVQILECALAATEPDGSLGRDSVVQYVQTLARIMGR